MENKQKSNPSNVPIGAFLLALFVIVFLLGQYAYQFGFRPLSLLGAGAKNTQRVLNERVRSTPVLVQPRRYPGTGVTLHKPELAKAGLTAMQGWFSDGLQIRVVGMKGQLVHQWKLDFHKLWPNPDHVKPKRNIPKSRYGYHSQGFHLEPDGSVIANFANLGAFKMSKCGEVLWKTDRMTHHSVTPSLDGGYWIPANRDYMKIPRKYFMLKLQYSHLEAGVGKYDELLLHVDNEGRVTSEISILESLIGAGLTHHLVNSFLIKNDDPTHVNDIVEVTLPLARKIAGASEGDLLVSVRQPHMLVVIDRDSGDLVWHKSGPWIRQHDPDIDAEGNITVFNNFAEIMGDAPLGSSIVQYEPGSGKVETLYPAGNQFSAKRGGRAFFTDLMGNHQVLSNGNILISESRFGRVFEVTPGGEVVWEYIQAYDEKRAALIEEVKRFNKNYFTFEDWACSP